MLKGRKSWRAVALGLALLVLLGAWLVFAPPSRPDIHVGMTADEVAQAVGDDFSVSPGVRLRDVLQLPYADLVLDFGPEGKVEQVVWQEIPL